MPKSTERLRYILILQMQNGDTWAPPSGYEARIIGGAIAHIGGTASALLIQSKTPYTFASLTNILSTVCTESFSINPVTTTTDYSQSATSRSEHTWFDSQLRLYFSGAATAFVRLIIEVVKIDEYTGEHLA